MTKPMKNILITGGLGHIGSKLIRKIPKNYNLTVVDNFHTQRYCSLFDMSRNVDFTECSFEEISSDVLQRSDVIIHLASITNASKSFDNAMMEEVNINKTKKFIDRCAKESNCKFIFPSSTSVYGTAAELVTEDDDSLLNPQSPYAESKIEIEKYLRPKHLNYTILRLGTVFGCSPGMRFHTAVNKFCYQASLGIPLTVWRQNYEQYRPYLGINDCVEAIKHILQNDECGETYNVITKNYKLKDIVSFIRSIKKIEVNMVDTPLLNQYSYKICTKKLKSLGFCPSDNLDDGIRLTMRMLECIKSC